jgi:uncharacterized protein
MSNKIYRRILKPPTQSFFLLGPRGSGKSTWMKTHFKTAYTFNLLDERLYQSLLQDPSLFSGRINRLPKRAWVSIDEVQRLPQLLNEAHRFIEDRGLRFILCGSSARKLRRAGVNLLAGRAIRKWMYPFVPEELQSDFNLEKTLRYGSIPIIWQSDSKRESLSTYVELYLKEEIQAEAVVKNLPGFSRFLPVAGLFHAQTLNVSSLARDAGVSRSTVNGYIQILEDTLMAFKLPAFEGKLRVREKKHPKFYWVDAGLARAVKKQFGPVSQEERGSLFEGWIANLLRVYGDYYNLYDSCYYWSPAEAKGIEVDFLLQRGKEFLAVEAKSTSKVSNQHLAGLRAIGSLRGIKKRILIHQGEESLRTADGIDILSVSDFLTALPSNF